MNRFIHTSSLRTFRHFNEEILNKVVSLFHNIIISLTLEFYLQNKIYLQSKDRRVNLLGVFSFIVID